LSYQFSACGCWETKRILCLKSAICTTKGKHKSFKFFHVISSALLHSEEESKIPVCCIYRTMKKVVFFKILNLIHDKHTKVNFLVYHQFVSFQLMYSSKTFTATTTGTIKQELLKIKTDDLTKVAWWWWWKGEQIFLTRIINSWKIKISRTK
jgi:hypothetical protein